MKRGREEGEIESLTTMANYLVLLSRGGGQNQSMAQYSPSRVFECKTCNRQFPSFQALGGHRASHKKPRLMGGEGQHQIQFQSSPAKPKTHECSVCGLEFSIGQALGGHMRRHRNAIAEALNNPSSPPIPPSQTTIVKRSNSRRVLCLDLNLTPLENDLEFQLLKPKPAPMVDCFI